jgi:hypothetical protein
MFGDIDCVGMRIGRGHTVLPGYEIAPRMGYVTIGRGDVPAHFQCTPFSESYNAEDGLRREAVWGYARAGASGADNY